MSRAVSMYALYGALAGLFCAPLFASPHGLGIIDWDQHLFYYGSVLKNLVEYGQLPFWNPWYCGGNVLWQNPQAALLSPVYPLTALTSLALAMKVNIFLHYWLGLAGMHLVLTRIFRLSFLPLVVYLSSLFALSGAPAMHLAVGHSVFLPAFYLPLLLFFFFRAIESRDIRDALLAGALLALIVYNGGLHILPMALGAAGVFSVIASLSARRWRPLLVAAVMTLAGLAYAAPKLLPVALYVTGDRFLDTRPTDEHPDAMTVNMLLHTYVDPYQERGSEFDAPIHGWYEYGNFIDSPGAFLIVASLAWAFAFRRSPERWLGLSLAGTAVLFLIISAGEFSRAAPASLAAYLPFFSSFRIPMRYTVAFVLFGVLTVGWVVRALEVDRRVPARAAAFVTMVCLAATLHLAIRNRSHLDQVFSVPPLAGQFALLGGSETLVTNRDSNPYAGNSPMLSELMSGRSSYNCYESLQLVHTADADNPIVFSDGQAQIVTTAFSPNRVDFSVVNGRESSRVFLNQNYSPGWRSSAGPVIVDPQSGRMSVTLPPGAAGKFTFTFVPPGLVPGLGVLALAILLSVVGWKRAFA